MIQVSCLYIQKYCKKNSLNLGGIKIQLAGVSHNGPLEVRKSFIKNAPGVRLAGRERNSQKLLAVKKILLFCPKGGLFFFRSMRK
jgi:hypothetical protein